MHSNEQNDSFKFSIDKGDSWFVNNIWKIGFSSIFLILLTAYLGRKNINITAISVLIVFLLGLFFLFEKYIQKYIETIHINFSNRSVEISLLRCNKTKIIPFDDIITIKVNGLVRIQTKEKTFLYKDLRNDGLFCGLNNIKKIEWGYLCKIFGPNSILRNELK